MKNVQQINGELFILLNGKETIKVDIVSLR